MVEMGVDDRIDRWIPPIIGIAKLHVLYKKIVYGIKVEYMQLGGENIVGELCCNKNSHKNATITMVKGEEIVEIHGRAGPTYIEGFSLITRRTDGSTKTYRPFGNADGGNIFNLWKYLRFLWKLRQTDH